MFCACFMCVCFIVTKPDIQKWFNLNPYCYLRVRASTNFNSSLSTCNSKVIHFLRIKINAPTECNFSGTGRDFNNIILEVKEIFAYFYSLSAVHSYHLSLYYMLHVNIILFLSGGKKYPINFNHFRSIRLVPSCR